MARRSAPTSASHSEDARSPGGSPAPGVIPARTGETLVGHWLGAGAWCAVFGGVAWGVISGRVDVPAAPVGWVLVALGALGPVLLVHAVVASLRAARFRGVLLRMDPEEGSLGGMLGGRIHVPGVDARHLREGGLAVQVSCVRRDPGSETVSERVVWTTEAVPTVARGAHGVELAFAVPLPDELPPVDPEPEGVRWYVRASGALPGFDLDASFSVPVARHDPPRSSSIPPAPDPSEGPREFESAGIRVHRDAGAVWIRYGTARSRSVGVAMKIFGGVFLGAAVFIALASGLFPLAWSSGFEVVFGLVSAVFVLTFGGVGVLLGLLGAWLLTNTLQVEVRPDRIRTRRRLLGVIPAGRHDLRTADVERVEARVTTQAGQGARAWVAYQVVAHTARGRVTLGDGIRGPALLARISGILERESGLEVALDVSGRRPGLRRSGRPGSG